MAAESAASVARPERMRLTIPVTALRILLASHHTRNRAAINKNGFFPALRKRAFSSYPSRAVLRARPSSPSASMPSPPPSDRRGPNTKTQHINFAATQIAVPTVDVEIPGAPTGNVLRSRRRHTSRELRKVPRVKHRFQSPAVALPLRPILEEHSVEPGEVLSHQISCRAPHSVRLFQKYLLYEIRV